jgi:AcrR family transcriptional regulator
MKSPFGTMGCMTEPVIRRTAAGERPLRRDAERNRRRILRAAREMFAERGLEVTLDDIGRHAGVGVGTVYRRFASKSALIQELFIEELDNLVASAELALERDDPWEGFAGFLIGALETMALDRGLRELLFAEVHGPGSDALAHAREKLMPAVTALIHRAQDAGLVRSDLEATDFPLIQYMISSVVRYTQPANTQAWKRYLTITLDGLRARPDSTPLTEPPLTPSEMDQVMGLPVPR